MGLENVMITGSQGFLGANLINILLDNYDVNIVALVRDKTKNDSLKLLNISEDSINIVYGDICNYDAMRRIMARYNIDTVFHLAAISIVSSAIKSPLQCFQTNIMGTANVLQAALDVGTVKAFVGASSDKAYGDSDILPYEETFPLNGLYVYPASKACADILMRSYYYNYDLPVAVTRCANLYGPGDPNFSRIVPNTINKICQEESPVLYSGVSTYIRDFVHVFDAVRAYLMLAEELHAGVPIIKGEAYNVSANDSWEIGKLISFIIEKMNFKGSIDFVDRDVDFKEIKEQKLSYDKIRQHIGYVPKYNIQNSMDYIIWWYENQFSLGVL